METIRDIEKHSRYKIVLTIDIACDRRSTSFSDYELWKEMWYLWWKDTKEILLAVLRKILKI